MARPRGQRRRGAGLAGRAASASSPCGGPCRASGRLRGGPGVASTIARTPARSWRLAPGRHDGGLEVGRVAHQLALDAAGESGVPAKLEGAEQAASSPKVSATPGRSIGSAPSRWSSAASTTRAEYLAAAVEGVPGHGVLLLSHTVGTYQRYATYRRYANRIQGAAPHFGPAEDETRPVHRRAAPPDICSEDDHERPKRSGPRRLSRRQQYSASTKRALVEVATELFTEQRLRRHQPRRDRRRRAGHQGRALPPLQRQAGAVRGRLRAGRGRRRTAIRKAVRTTRTRGRRRVVGPARVPRSGPGAGSTAGW